MDNSLKSSPSNSYKENKSPLEILEEIAPEINTKVTLLPPINLDKVLYSYINKRGHYVSGLPFFLLLTAFFGLR